MPLIIPKSLMCPSTLPDVWHYRVRATIGDPGVSILWLGDSKFDLQLSVWQHVQLSKHISGNAEDKFKADPSPSGSLYPSSSLCRSVPEHPTIHLVLLQGQCYHWLVWCPYTVTGWDSNFYLSVAARQIVEENLRKHKRWSQVRSVSEIYSTCCWEIKHSTYQHPPHPPPPPPHPHPDERSRKKATKQNLKPQAAMKTGTQSPVLMTGVLLARWTSWPLHPAWYLLGRQVMQWLTCLLSSKHLLSVLDSSKHLLSVLECRFKSQSGFEFGTLVCGICWGLLLGVFCGYSSFLPSPIG